MPTHIDTINTNSTSGSFRRIGPLHRALGELIMDFSQLYLGAGVPDYPSLSAEACDHEAVKDHLLAVAQICGRYLRKVGAEVEYNAASSIDMKCFAETTFTDALEGNATYELDCAAERAREQALEHAAASRHGSGSLLFSMLIAGRMR